MTYMAHGHPRFTWDPGKDSANLKKHGVDFQEAASVFFDDYAQLIDDPDHSAVEERFIIMGLSSNLRILIVCHCYRCDDDEIRILSARKALKHEMKQYRR